MSQHKRSQKRNKRKKNMQRKAELVFADENQEYALVTKMVGNGRCLLKLNNGLEALGVIRGTMKHRAWIQVDDLVLVSCRDFQDGKVDIIHKYPADHKRQVMDMESISFVQEEKSDGEVVFDFDDI